ncbi:STAS domain-containing protein [Streptomyces sp. XM83C]|uniref:STAS domain-containing protein n=1 Tax=Streptomyces thermocoprophilus TaxID=78356 RepID=A0ABV5VM33_9ACTN|nr:STAS domain-containing protein [Streptomyces sp. XM83C]MCK1820885.1 STAS domain-containing protein [Streptomyces sp. XM83C]
MSCRRPTGLPHVDATTPAVSIFGPVTPGDVPELCRTVRVLLETTGAAAVVCDVAALGPPGLATVDLLARLQLTARRAGGRIRLRAPDPALCALLHLVGLRFELEGQTEQREETLGVQEAVEPGDPSL